MLPRRLTPVSSHGDRWRDIWSLTTWYQIEMEKRGEGLQQPALRSWWVMCPLTAAPEQRSQPAVLLICRASGPIWPGNWVGLHSQPIGHTGHGAHSTAPSRRKANSQSTAQDNLKSHPSGKPGHRYPEAASYIPLWQGAKPAAPPKCSA